MNLYWKKNYKRNTLNVFFLLQLWYPAAFILRCCLLSPTSILVLHGTLILSPISFKMLFASLFERIFKSEFQTYTSLVNPMAFCSTSPCLDMAHQNNILVNTKPDCFFLMRCIVVKKGCKICKFPVKPGEFHWFLLLWSQQSKMSENSISKRLIIELELNKCVWMELE